jgi:hypothetical protein
MGNPATAFANMFTSMACPHFAREWMSEPLAIVASDFSLE